MRHYSLSLRERRILLPQRGLTLIHLCPLTGKIPFSTTTSGGSSSSSSSSSSSITSLLHHRPRMSTLRLLHWYPMTTIAQALLLPPSLLLLPSHHHHHYHHLQVLEIGCFERKHNKRGLSLLLQSLGGGWGRNITELVLAFDSQPPIGE